MTPAVQERKRSRLRHLRSGSDYPVEQRSHEAPTPYTRASSNAGLDPRMARHLLIANVETHGVVGSPVALLIGWEFRFAGNSGDGIDLDDAHSQIVRVTGRRETLATRPLRVRVWMTPTARTPLIGRSVGLLDPLGRPLPELGLVRQSASLL